MFEHEDYQDNTIEELFKIQEDLIARFNSLQAELDPLEREQSTIHTRLGVVRHILTERLLASPRLPQDDGAPETVDSEGAQCG